LKLGCSFVPIYQVLNLERNLAAIQSDHSELDTFPTYGSIGDTAHFYRYGKLVDPQRSTVGNPDNLPEVRFTLIGKPQKTQAAPMRLCRSQEWFSRNPALFLQTPEQELS
jgi:hypothetical protein